MPCSLKNFAETFLRFMNEILREILFPFTYIGHAFIANPKADTHSQLLEQIFALPKNYYIQIRVENEELGVTSIDFFGHPVF